MVAQRRNTRLWIVVAVLAAFVVLVPLRPAHATAPGPNGRLVFVNGASIYTVSVEGSALSGALAAGSSPSWSPATDKIAYVDAGGQLAIMNADGTSQAEVLNGVATISASSVAWAPAGTTLAYSDGTNIFTVPVAGGAPTQITFGAVHNVDPAWSPDGSRIVFASDRDGDYEIYVMNSDGSDQTPLTSSGGADRDPSWSPDAATIAFDSDRDGIKQIYAIAASGGAATRLTNEASTDSGATWSPDGTTIAFSKGGSLSTVSSSGGAPSAAITAGTSPEWGLAFGVTAPPVISPSTGLAAGTVLTTSNGTWNGSPNGFNYQWRRCSSAGSNCTNIAGATTSQHTLTAADGGSTIRVTVTANGLGGSTSVTSDQTDVVGSTVPANTTLPRISFSGGAPVQDTAASVITGSWSGTGPFTFTYQWERCNSFGVGCGLAGSAAATYTPSSSDIGHSLRVIVTATNAAGQSASAESNATPPVAGILPATVAAPSVSDTTPVVAQTLTGSVGTWSGRQPVTFTYQWEKCDASSCQPLPIGDRTSFAVTSDLVGYRLAFHVYAKNSAGVGDSRSEYTQPVGVNAPAVATRPSITGVNAVGQQLLASPGVWSSTAGLITYSYVWQRCDTLGNGCKPIPGGTSSTYIQTQDDLASTIRVYVTATNRSGSATAPSDHTYPTMPRIKFRPAVSVPPKVLDAPSVGLKIRMSDGLWTGDKPMRFSRRWRRCDATGARCKVLPLRGRTYTVTIADLGSTLRAVVVGKNANGAATAISEATDVVLLKKKPRSRRIVGSNGPNYLAGGGGDDTLLGRGGNDTLLGGAGDDRLDGGLGADVLIGGGGKDRIFGGAGSDTVIANDGSDDLIDCGPGRDRAVVDAGDKTENCELVQTVSTPEAPPTSTTTTTTRGTTTDDTPTTTDDFTTTEDSTTTDETVADLRSR